MTASTTTICENIDVDAAEIRALVKSASKGLKKSRGREHDALRIAAVDLMMRANTPGAQTIPVSARRLSQLREMASSIA